MPTTEFSMLIVDESTENFLSAQKSYQFLQMIENFSVLFNAIHESKWTKNFLSPSKRDKRIQWFQWKQCIQHSERVAVGSMVRSCVYLVGLMFENRTCKLHFTYTICVKCFTIKFFLNNLFEMISLADIYIWNILKQFFFKFTKYDFLFNEFVW